jgi:hypothetical protein
MKTARRKHFIPTVSLAFMLAVCVMAVPSAQAQQTLCDFDPTIPQGPAAPPPQQANPPYFVWATFNAGDQRTQPGQHSGLVGWTGDIDDQTFAQQTQAAIVNAGGYLKEPLVYVFGECYGGGMIDDLRLKVVLNPMSIVTAAFFNQKANYPSRPGNGTDFVQAYINALNALPVNNNNTAQQLAAQAATDDPYGWSANPNPARQGEPMGLETPEYYSQVRGDGISLQRPAGEVNTVILWAGQPEVDDDIQLSQLIGTLLALGYSKDNIVVFFGAGRYSGAQGFSRVAATMQANNFDPTHLRVADPADFNNVLRGWAFPANVNNPPQFFFFLADDHGCNNAFMNQEKGGNGLPGQHGGGPVPTGGPDPWGNDGGSQLPQPPRG